MTRELIPVGKGTIPALYKRMQIAITECHSVDECKHIATQAGAIAAYYQQIKDDESVKKFLQIKLRAWRRIGEILIGAGVDKSKCNTLSDGSFNMTEYIRRIRAAFKGQKEIEEINDGAFRQALKIAEIPRDFFNQNVGKHANIDSLVGAFALIQRREWEATPEGQAKLKEQEKRWAEAEKRHKADEAIQEKYHQERLREAVKLQQAQAAEAADLKALENAREEAFEEVGITLDRRDRKQMQQIVFLLKKSIHETLRQAAFDNRMTMQAILRAGLMMWFIAHGYTVPTEDMKLPDREKPRDPTRYRSFFKD